jgi:hypothetical protein
MQPNLDVAPNGTVAVSFYDRRLRCPAEGGAEAAGSGVQYDPGTAASPGTPWGRANYCINTAIQFYKPDLTPIGKNIRLSKHTWDPQLSAMHPSCYCVRHLHRRYFSIDSPQAHLCDLGVDVNYAGETRPSTSSRWWPDQDAVIARTRPAREIPRC